MLKNSTAYGYNCIFGDEIHTKNFFYFWCRRSIVMLIFDCLHIIILVILHLYLRRIYWCRYHARLICIPCAVPYYKRLINFGHCFITTLRSRGRIKRGWFIAMDIASKPSVDFVYIIVEPAAEFDVGHSAVFP